MDKQIFKIEFYVPASHLDAVKAALFAAGAGRVGAYEQCAWQTQGTGQYCPGSEADPFIGEKNKVETVAEYKVELVCEEKCLKPALAAMKQAHPYEEPAYSVLRLEMI